MKNYIKLGDVVEVESNPFFPALVGSQGVVKQVLAGKQCLIEFPTKKRNANLENLEEKRSSKLQSGFFLFSTFLC